MRTELHTSNIQSSAKTENQNFYALATLIMAFVGYLAYQVDYVLGISVLRIVYSVLLYSTLLLILYVFLSNENRKKLSGDIKYSLYFIAVFVFIVFNISTDFENPKYSAITLFNNSFALASIFPVLGLIIGINTRDSGQINRLLQIAAILFCIYAIYTLSKREFAPKVFTAIVLPFAVFALTEKKYWQVILVFGIAAIHSIIVDYRVLLLSMLMFSFLYASLNITRKYSILKFVILATTTVAMYFVITDLDAILEIFQSSKSLGNTSTDTRSFLYKEIFDDMQPAELLTGRGFLGTYFSPYFYQIRESGIPEYYIRFTVEVGYLELLLKGGYIYVTLYFLPIVYTALNAIFLKKDELLLTFNIGIYLVTEFFICFFENIPEYSIHNFLIFLLAGYAYSQIKDAKKKAVKNTIKPKRAFEV
jgi:hypothetical protein